MNDKNFVTMGFELCPICAQRHSDSVLIDKRLKNSLPQDGIFTGFSLCPEHKAMTAEYLGIVELKGTPDGNNASLIDTWSRRTGQFGMLRREVVNHVFNVDLPAGTELIFMDEEGMAKLKSMMPKPPANDTPAGAEG